MNSRLVAALLLFVLTLAAIAGGQTATQKKKAATTGKRTTAKVAPKQPEALSPSFKEKGALAYEAIDRMPDGLERVPAAQYDTRKLDAEKTLADAKRARTTPADKDAYEVLSAGYFAKELAHTHDNDLDEVSKDIDVQLQCPIESHVTFEGGDDLTDRGRETAAAKTCISMHKAEFQRLESKTVGDK
jgi:hypothetical protein